MHITFKTSMWEKVTIPKEVESEILKKVKAGEIISSNYITDNYEDSEVSELYETYHSLSPLENNGDATIELCDDKGMEIFNNGTDIELCKTAVLSTGHLPHSEFQNLRSYSIEAFGTIPHKFGVMTTLPPYSDFMEHAELLENELPVFFNIAKSLLRNGISRIEFDQDGPQCKEFKIFNW